MSKLAELIRDRRDTPVVVTSLPLSPERERRKRMAKYVIAMSIRTVCLPVAVLVDGPARWVAALGAILLPYFAVIIANAVDPGAGEMLEPVPPQLRQLDTPASSVEGASRQVVTLQ